VFTALVACPASVLTCPAARLDDTGQAPPDGRACSVPEGDLAAVFQSRQIGLAHPLPQYCSIY